MSFGAEKLKVGNLFRLITEYNTIHEQKLLDVNNARIDLELAAKNTEVRIHSDSMWDIDVLSRLALTTTDEFFLESLLSNVKGHIISYQTWFKKVETTQNLSLLKT